MKFPASRKTVSSRASGSWEGRETRLMMTDGPGMAITAFVARMRRSSRKVPIACVTAPVSLTELSETAFCGRGTTPASVMVRLEPCGRTASSLIALEPISRLM